MTDFVRNGNLILPVEPPKPAPKPPPDGSLVFEWDVQRSKAHKALQTLWHVCNERLAPDGKKSERCDAVMVLARQLCGNAVEFETLT